MIYTVRFVQHHTYYVDADDKDEAFDKAKEEFVEDMRRPIAITTYDDVEIEEW